MFFSFLFGVQVGPGLADFGGVKSHFMLGGLPVAADPCKKFEKISGTNDPRNYLIQLVV